MRADVFRLAVLVLVLGLSLFPLRGAAAGDAIRLDVPAFGGPPQRCGPTAFRMVMAYYGAPDSAAREGDRAYDPALQGALVTDLAAAARRAGFDAVVAETTTAGLAALVAAGVPPIVLYQQGRGPITTPHYAVVSGWDAARERFLLNDGRSRPVTMSRADLERRWRPAGSRALVIRRRSP